MADFSAFAGRACPQWYARPQLGIFIHWGIFAVPAYAPPGTAITSLLHSDYDEAFVHVPYAEWYENALRFPHSQTAQRHARLWPGRAYRDFRADFDTAAAAFDANAWADLFAQSNAGYVVFVTKHHDGYCLWPTDVANPHAPGWHSSRDFVGELADAVRARGMRFGVYYSGGLDWRFDATPIGNFGDMFAAVPLDPAYTGYACAQLRELISRYRPSVLWNDIAWPDEATLPALFADYYDAVPDGVINDRWLADRALFTALHDDAGRRGFNDVIKASLAGGTELPAPAPPHCDFRTVEYADGVHMGDQKWESCRGIGLAFGYNAAETEGDFLTGPALIDLYRDVTGRGGNLLLNLGPRADGSIPQSQLAPLAALAQALARGT